VGGGEHRILKLHATLSAVCTSPGQRQPRHVGNIVIGEGAAQPQHRTDTLQKKQASRLAILIAVTIGLPQPQCEKNGKTSDKDKRKMGQLM
jgi:hypothetical protein